MGGEKLPALTARELLVILRRPGDRRRVTVPIHVGRTLKKGLLNGILKDIGLTVEEFNRLR